MSRSFSQYIPGRRSAVSNDIEMRPLVHHGGGNSKIFRGSTSSGSNSVARMMEKLQTVSNWDEGKFRLSKSKSEKKKTKSHFAVNIPTRMMVHVMIIFFLIPLLLGLLMVAKALFFGLKEDEQHPLHKKLPRSHLRTGTGGDVGHDLTDAGGSTLSTGIQTMLDVQDNHDGVVNINEPISSSIDEKNNNEESTASTSGEMEMEFYENHVEESENDTSSTASLLDTGSSSSLTANDNTDVTSTQSDEKYTSESYSTLFDENLSDRTASDVTDTTNSEKDQDSENDETHDLKRV